MNKNAIIILNYNDWKTTIKMISVIKEYKCFDYIIIVDNCSTDESVEQLRLLCNEKILLLVADENKGYAAGNNIGARYASEFLKVDNIFISNPDILCSEESIAKILDAINSKYEMVTGLIYNLDKNGQFHVFSTFGWKVPSYLDMISNCFLTIYKFRRSVLKNSIYFNLNDVKENSILEVEAVSGCFFAIRATVLKEVSYFDERTFLYHEENILGYKLKSRGYKVAVCTDAPIYHCENVNKNSSLKKLLFTYKTTLKSALIYIKYYLKKNSIFLFFYCVCFWASRIENLIIKRLIRSR